jgi:arabinose-5-phosphate isomerase
MSIQNKELNVGNVMLPPENFPVINENSIVKEALEKMDAFRLGIVCITDNDEQLLGIITDGDIRRKLLAVQKPLSAFFIDDAINQAIKNSFTVSSDMSLVEAVNLMEKKQVWDLPVVDDNKLIGLLHLHPAVKSLLGG